MKAYTIDIDGTRTEVQPANGIDFKLKELYALVGCDIIQILRITNGRIMVLDDNGRMNKKLPNPMASKVYMEGREAYTDKKREENRKFWEDNGFAYEQIGTVEDFNNIVGKVLVCPVEMVK